MRSIRGILTIASLGSILALPGGRVVSAPPSGDRLKVSIEVVANPLEGPPRSGCAASETVPAEGATWWVAFGQSKPDPAKRWQAVGSQVACGRSSPGAATAPLTDRAAAPYFTASVKTTAGYLPSMLTPERVLLLDVAASFRRLAGFSKGGDPVYDPSEMRRNFFFLDGREALIPLVIADDAEAGAFGIREVFLKIVVAPARDESAAAYGALSLSSGPQGGEILLDGGVAGTAGASTVTVLRNVPEGLHDVRLRDSSGREIGAMVRVADRRTALVDLSHPDTARGSSTFRLVSLGKNAQGFEEFRRESDGAVAVRIPAGEILMGNKETEGAPLEHRVYVSEFMMDKLPVSWAQFKRFTAATGLPLPPHEPYWGIHDDHPAVYVTWEEAKTYCEWAGGRLPTEAEREKGARGTDDRKYPWGNEEPDHDRAVFRHEWGWEATEPVGSHPTGASPYGLLDVGGTVWEFCSDWYDRDYYQNSPARDPKGPLSGNARVVRGGSWDSRPTVLSASCRNWAYRGYREGDFGFRCAMNAPR